MEPQNSRKRTVRDLQVNLAKYLIKLKEGQRLESIREIAASTQMSIGAVSTALNGLQDIGAVTIQRRGHLGSIVEELSVAKLWGVIEQGPLVIALSLPMHNRFEGLATGLKISFEKAGIEAFLIFIRGSRTRLKALTANRCHAVLMSGLAAEKLCGKDYEMLFSLPPKSWVADYNVFQRMDVDPGKPLRVAVDPDSFDHRYLTDLEFKGQNIDIHHVSFVHISRLLKNCEIDAAIWTSDQNESYLGEGITSRPLSQHVMEKEGDKSVSAAFVGRKGSEAVRAILQTCINPDDVMRIQSEIVAGRMVPEY